MDNPYQAPAAVVGPQPGMGHAFRDATQLTTVCRYLLYASIMVSLASIAISAREIGLLQQAATGLIGHDEADEAIALQSLLVLPLLVVLIAGYIAIGMWIYRMASNAWALSHPRPLAHRPGWAVGWYFIPIVNLWKPYQALKEVWQASSEPQEPERIAVPWLFPVWWSLWLAANFASNIAGRLSWRAETPDDANAAAIVSIVSDAVNVPLCLVFLALMAALHRTQQRQHANPAPKPPEAGFNPASASSVPSLPR
jgi:hypothetical protein